MHPYRLDDDRRLARRQRAGDALAREILIERHLPLSRALAARYRRSAEPMDDLRQVAAVGLVKAVDRWDPERGFEFATFAVPTILGELRRHFRDATWDVRPPRPVQELHQQVDRARDALYGRHGREPRPHELAQHLDRPYAAVVEALRAGHGRHVRSLDAAVHDDPEQATTVAETVGGDDIEYERTEVRLTLDRLLRTLDRRAREVLRLRFVLELQQAEIGERIGCSQMHVSRIIRAALEKLALAAAAE